MVGAMDELRTSAGADATDDVADDQLLRFADVVVNEATREVWRGSARVELTRTEFDLLRFFLLNPRRVLSKQLILDRVWSEDFVGDPNIVETYVSYLRRKLDPLGPPLIHTVRLVGYVLREPTT
jgi:two-component system OmpR family response regulator